jgi:predicted esterase
MIVYFHGVMSDGFRDIPTLKGYTGSPVEETGLIQFARNNGILLVVPSPAYSYVFLDKEARGWLPFEKEMDGIEKIIETVMDRYPVDANGVYLAGISAGAGMCHQLANRNPERYNAILSHSQGYVDEKGLPLTPGNPGPRFGVVFCTTRGDYDNLIAICEESAERYRHAGYRTAVLKDLPPLSHSWSKESNRRFWRYLKELGQYTGQSTQRSGSQP